MPGFKGRGKPYICTSKIRRLRYFIKLAYLGTPYYGWQRQPQHTSVQQVLEEALSMLLRQSIAITGAGRTDTGVHATQMWAHFDVDDKAFAKADLDQLTYKLNSFLDKSIAIHDIVPVVKEAHARFDASRRSYVYKMTTVKDPFTTDKVYYLKTELDIDAMNEAASLLKTHTDFESFAKAKTDVKTYLCTITKAHWTQQGTELYFEISADRFLRNMVRAIVGTLLEIGLQKQSPQWINEVIQHKDRQAAGTSVPAHGLYLTEVTYPTSIFLTNE